MKNKKLIGQLEFIQEYECKTDAEKKAIDKAIKILEGQPNTGRWIWKSGKTIDYCSCSVCKKGQWEIEWNYCPNCGAKMIEPQESECDD